MEARVITVKTVISISAILVATCYASAQAPPAAQPAAAQAAPAWSPSQSIGMFAFP